MGPVKIALLGAGEVHLPAPERAEAKCNAPSSITMTLYCASDERGEATKAVSAELSPALARDLAIRLWLAADAADYAVD